MDTKASLSLQQQTRRGSSTQEAVNHHRWKWVTLPLLRRGGASHGAVRERRVILQIRFGVETCWRFDAVVRMNRVSSLRKGNGSVHVVIEKPKSYKEPVALAVKYMCWSTSTKK